MYMYIFIPHSDPLSELICDVIFVSGVDKYLP